MSNNGKGVFTAPNAGISEQVIIAVEGRLAEKHDKESARQRPAIRVLIVTAGNSDEFT